MVQGVEYIATQLCFDVYDFTIWDGIQPGYAKPC